MNLPREAALSKTATISSRKGSADLGNKEEDAFLPSFRHGRRI